MSEELLKAYHQAIYSVGLPSGEIVLKVGERNEGLIQLLVQENVTEWAYITASNPQSKILAEEENKLRNSKLESLLKSQQYRYFNGEGKSVDGSWPAETSFLILGISEKEAVKLGLQFQQSGILLGGSSGTPVLRML